MSSAMQDAFFDEIRAYEFVERRVWPHGPVCPRCNENARIGKLKGGTTRIGMYKCYRCRKPFTIKVGTVLESSHVPMNVWLRAICLVCLAQREISANQLAHALGTSLRTACFIRARIRRAWESADAEPDPEDPQAGQFDGASTPRSELARLFSGPHRQLPWGRGAPLPAGAWARRASRADRYASHRRCAAPWPSALSRRPDTSTE